MRPGEVRRIIIERKNRSDGAPLIRVGVQGVEDELEFQGMIQLAMKIPAHQVTALPVTMRISFEEMIADAANRDETEMEEPAADTAVVEFKRRDI